MKVVQLHECTPKQFLNPTPPQNSPLAAQKVKMTPTLSQNQMPEFNETQKMKVVQLHEWTQKDLLNPTQIQNQPIRAPKSKKIK